jgi:hypothetical protein
MQRLLCANASIFGKITRAAARGQAGANRREWRPTLKQAQQCRTRVAHDASGTMSMTEIPAQDVGIAPQPTFV